MSKLRNKKYSDTSFRTPLLKEVTIFYLDKATKASSMFVLISNFKFSFDPIYFDPICFDAINFGLFYRPRMQTAQVQRNMTRNDCLTIAIAITFLASIHFRSCCAQNQKKKVTSSFISFR